MEQQLDLNLPKKCVSAKENLDEQVKMTQDAIAVLEEQAKYTGATNLIKAVEVLKGHVEEKLTPSYKETAEFYEKTGEESARLFAVLG